MKSKPKKPESIKVTRKVYEGLEAVRESGNTSMLDYQGVMYYANEMKEYATVMWLHNNKKLYSKGIFVGFEIEEES